MIRREEVDTIEEIRAMFEKVFGRLEAIDDKLVSLESKPVKPVKSVKPAKEKERKEQ